MFPHPSHTSLMESETLLSERPVFKDIPPVPQEMPLDALQDLMIRPALSGGRWDKELYEEQMHKLLDLIEKGPENTSSKWMGSFWLKQITPPMEELTGAVYDYLFFRRDAMEHMLRNPERPVPTDLFDGIEKRHDKVLMEWKRLSYVLECVEKEWNTMATH